MAKPTFSGTTQEVLLAIIANDINNNTKVTITDNDYTLANLLTIVGAATTYPVVLQKTAAAVAIEGNAADLITMLAGVSSYTGALKATDAAGVSAAQLNTIAEGTTGKVTATLAPGTTINAATVAALKDVKATDAITFAPTTDTDLDGNAEINALISLNKILPKADWSSINTIEGTANDVSIIKQALAIAKNPALTVEITAGIISAEDANAIAKLASGALTATIKDGSVAATLKALANVNASDALTFTSTDKTVKATDLVALNSKIDTGTYTSIETITADAKDVSYVSAALAIASNADVTITGTITAAQANAIADATTGVVTATVEPDTAANLVAKLSDTDTDDILTLAVNGTTATAANLNTLAVVTGGKIKLDATEVAGDANALKVLYVTNKASFTALGNENVTITGTPAAVDLNTIAAATTGKVTATLDPTTTINAATVAALKDVKATDAITFVPTTDTDLDGKDELNALLAIKKLIPNADFSAIVTIDADAKDVALVKSVLKDVADNVAVTITDDISAADANAIAKATNGVVTATIKDGSVVATLKALKDVDPADSDVLTFKATDKTVKATDLVELAALVNLDADSVTTVTGDAKDTADIKDALDNIVTANNPEVKISGIVANDDANIADILDGTIGKVTAKIEAGTATVLAALLANGAATDALDVTVNGATATAANLAIIDSKTALKVKVDAKEVTGDFADLNTLYFTNKVNFSNLGNEDVGIAAGVANSALNVDTILKATTGVVTAAVNGDKANILVSQLKNANAKDALDITVLTDTNGTSAKDLIALTKKTSEVVVATNITTHGIVGSVADINAVIKADTDGKLDLDGAVAYNVTGTITAAQANAIADATNGVVTATVAADTAAKLVTALANAGVADILTLKVNGATAAATDLITLNGKTAGKITVDAKEITGIAADVKTVLTTAAAEISGQEKAAVKLTAPVAVAAVADVNAILAATTGVVTATVSSGTATALVAGLTNATAKDKLTLEVTGTATATELLALDDKTAVKVDASAVTAVTGTAADVKKLLASKGVDVSKTTDINLSDLVVKAADVSSVAKATIGSVTAKVEADTAAKLNAALTDKDENALTLTVNGATATAKDLISLDGKTSEDIVLNVGAITGNIDEITKVFVTDADNFTNEDTTAATISGEITAAQADAIADKTSGVVTATIKADSAAVLNTVLADSGSQVNAYKLTVNGTTETAANLVALDGKTSVTVNAAAIQTIEGTATAVKAAYEANALKTISGLGNETVDLSAATDANASLVKAINDYTTGVITLDTLHTTAGDFSLSLLGDLKGIRGLVEIDTSSVDTDMTISLKDLLASNDSVNSFTFDIVGDVDDTVKFTDTTGWTLDLASDVDKSIYVNETNTQVITINHTDVVVVA